MSFLGSCEPGLRDRILRLSTGSCNRAKKPSTPQTQQPQSDQTPPLKSESVSLKQENDQSNANAASQVAGILSADKSALIKRYEAKLLLQQATVTRLKNECFSLQSKLKEVQEERSLVPVFQEKAVASAKAVAYWQDQAAKLEKKCLEKDKRIIKLETVIAKTKGIKDLIQPAQISSPAVSYEPPDEAILGYSRQRVRQLLGHQDTPDIVEKKRAPPDSFDDPLLASVDNLATSIAYSRGIHFCN